MPPQATSTETLTRLSLRDLRTSLLGAEALDIAAGECVALMGASGSGKSKLMRAIADLDPSEGRLALDGQPRDSLAAPAWRRLVAYVPAESGWWAERVVEHFVETKPSPELLTAVGLTETALDWQVSRLSTGERQRLALVRALVLAPKVLLLDEPTSSLDKEATTAVERLLKEEMARGTAILLVTHDPSQAERLANRRFRMEGGQLRTEGAAAGDAEAAAS